MQRTGKGFMEGRKAEEMVLCNSNRCNLFAGYFDNCDEYFFQKLDWCVMRKHGCFYIHCTTKYLVT